MTVFAFMKSFYSDNHKSVKDNHAGDKKKFYFLTLPILMICCAHQRLQLLLDHRSKHIKLIGTTTNL